MNWRVYVEDGRESKPGRFISTTPVHFYPARLSYYEAYNLLVFIFYLFASSPHPSPVTITGPQGHCRHSLFCYIIIAVAFAS